MAIRRYNPPGILLPFGSRPSPRPLPPMQSGKPVTSDQPSEMRVDSPSTSAPAESSGSPDATRVFQPARAESVTGNSSPVVDVSATDPQETAREPTQNGSAVQAVNVDGMEATAISPEASSPSEPAVSAQTMPPLEPGRIEIVTIPAETSAGLAGANQLGTVSSDRMETAAAVEAPPDDDAFEESDLPEVGPDYTTNEPRWSGLDGPRPSPSLARARTQPAAAAEAPPDDGACEEWDLPEVEPDYVPSGPRRSGLDGPRPGLDGPRPGLARARDDDWPRLFTYADLCRIQSEEPEFILKNSLLAGTVTALIGPPTVGKSLYSIQIAVCVASGKPLAGELPAAPQPVMLVNAEDSAAEMARRIRAAVQAVNADEALIQRNLTVMDMSRTFTIVKKGGGTIRVEPTPEVMRIFRKAKRMGIKLIIFDPFVELYGADENSNEDMHAVLACLRTLARDTGCSVVIVHHAGKIEGNRITLNSSRGASSLGATVRAARAVSELDKADIARLQLDAGDERNHFKVDDLKMSYGPRKLQPTYFRRENVTIAGIATARIVVVDPDRQIGEQELP